MKKKVYDFIMKGPKVLGCTISLCLTIANAIVVILLSILSCKKFMKGWKIVGVIGSCGLTSVIAWLTSRWSFKIDCKNEGVYFKHFSYIDRIKWIVKGDDYLKECYEDPYEE